MTKNPLVPLFLLIATVVGANLLVATVDPFEVGFGQVAPAGVLLAGVAFTLRDWLHEAAGRAWRQYIAVAIIVGALASYLVGLATGTTFPGGPTVGRIALAGAAAFAISELVDALVYVPLRERSLLLAVTVSGLVGLVVDSYVFLTIAFGNLDFFWGQVLGKGYVLLATVGIVALLRRRRTAA